MPPLYRIDVGKDVYYALDDSEKQGVLDRIEAKKKKGNINVQRFKGLGEMSPIQLRETTMAPDTRRLVQLTVKSDDSKEQDEDAVSKMDMMLAKKRAGDRRVWIEKNGNPYGADILDPAGKQAGILYNFKQRDFQPHVRMVEDNLISVVPHNWRLFTNLSSQSAP